MNQVNLNTIMGVHVWNHTTKLIEEQLRTNDPNTFLTGVLMQRAKDGHTKTKILKRYVFETLDDYIHKEKEIVDMVLQHNARFYLNPTTKHYKGVILDMMSKQVELLRQDTDYRYVGRMFESMADKNTGIKDKRLWIIDIDFDTPEMKQTFVLTELLDALKHKVSTSVWGKTIRFVNETKNGYHIIMQPSNKLDIKKVMEAFGVTNYEIKINNMTPIIYCEPYKVGLVHMVEKS